MWQKTKQTLPVNNHVASGGCSLYFTQVIGASQHLQSSTSILDELFFGFTTLYWVWGDSTQARGGHHRGGMPSFPARGHVGKVRMANDFQSNLVQLKTWSWGFETIEIPALGPW